MGHSREPRSPPEHLGHLHAGLAAAATAMERALPLLDVPPNVLLGVFSKLTELADAGEWPV